MSRRLAVMKKVVEEAPKSKKPILSIVSSQKNPSAHPKHITPVTTDSMKLYFKEISRVPLLTAVEEVELAKRVEKGDQKAKQKMTAANLRLVINIAKKYSNQ